MDLDVTNVNKYQLDGIDDCGLNLKKIVLMVLFKCLAGRLNAKTISVYLVVNYQAVEVSRSL